MRRVKQRDVQVGDTVVFLGTPHLITELEPYDHPSFPESFAVARDDLGWSFTLSDGSFSYLDVAG